MNKEMLVEIANDILVNPERFDMKMFESTGDCGTAHCIAGNAIMRGARAKGFKPSGLADAMNQLETIYGKFYGSCCAIGAIVLDITEERSYGLFYSDNWIEEFADRYEEASKDPEERAKVAHDYIMAVVNGKVEL